METSKKNGRLIRLLMIILPMCIIYWGQPTLTMGAGQAVVGAAQNAGGGGRVAVAILGGAIEWSVRGLVIGIRSGLQWLGSKAFNFVRDRLSKIAERNDGVVADMVAHIIAGIDAGMSDN
jgi:hypothetical protein